MPLAQQLMPLAQQLMPLAQQLMPLAQQHCAGGVTVSGWDNPTAGCESFSLFTSKQQVFLNDARRKAGGQQ
ncbi:MAG: hypothetical protein FWD31_03825 [Planctomycetaceae bacterium]|nr:hypothetical protein [Planctomycetaceae bacterium]